MNGLVTSIVDRYPAAGVRTVASTNLANLSEVVGEVSFADDATFVRAAEAANSGRPQKARMDTVEPTPDTTVRL